MIALINLPSPFLIDDRVMPPLGVLYVATYLRYHGVDCEVIDLAGIPSERYPDILERKLNGTKIVGISVVTPQFSVAKEVLSILRCTYPGTRVVIGGPHATTDPGSCYQFDHVVRGEGEVAMLHLKDWIDLDSEEYVEYPRITDIDTIPYPDRNLIDICSYKYYLDDELCTTVMTSRGCYADCAFCSNKAIWGSKVRTHSPEYTHAEIKYLKSLGFRAFMFFDDVFTYPKARFEATARLLGGENVIYRCFVRSDTATEKTLRTLKDTGCVEIGFGAESGSQAILDTVGKHNSVENNTRLVENAHRIGLRVKAFLMVGLPGETHETAQATYDWVRNVHPDDFDIAVYKPYRGTRIMDNPGAYDIVIDHAAYEDAWYKGKRGEYISSSHTSGLTAEEIVEWRDRTERELKGV